MWWKIELFRKNKKYDKDKLEVFCADNDININKPLIHYCIRTGISSSDIACFIINENYIDFNSLAEEIIKNGFYIPVANFNGKIIFTPEMFFNNKIIKLYEMKSK